METELRTEALRAGEEDGRRPTEWRWGGRSEAWRQRGAVVGERRKRKRKRKRKGRNAIAGGAKL
jgi:hypothetical protein